MSADILKYTRQISNYLTGNTAPNNLRAVVKQIRDAIALVSGQSYDQVAKPTGTVAIGATWTKRNNIGFIEGIFTYNSNNEWAGGLEVVNTASSNSTSFTAFIAPGYNVRLEKYQITALANQTHDVNNYVAFTLSRNFIVNSGGVLSSSNAVIGSVLDTKAIAGDFTLSLTLNELLDCTSNPTIGNGKQRNFSLSTTRSGFTNNGTTFTFAGAIQSLYYRKVIV